MHQVALDLYESTEGSDFRRRSEKGGHPFPFDTRQFKLMQKERQIVEMIIAWSVVTLDSAMNHALAEIIEDRDFAIQAIEHPRSAVKSLGLINECNSELAIKLFLLCAISSVPAPSITVAETLAKQRNSIIHDKPFDLIDHGDGDVDINYLTKRERDNGQVRSFLYLKGFYSDCDQVMKNILSAWEPHHLGMEEISFRRL